VQHNAHITKKRPARKIGRGGLENGSGGLQNTPGGITYSFPGFTAKPHRPENLAANIARKPPETIFMIPRTV
jgi:hypothetical protein